MRTTRTTRLLVLLAVGAILVTACGQSTTPSAPSGSQEPGSSAAPGSTVPEPTAAQTFSVPSFSPADLRWYCCLGTGEDPTQKPTEDKVAAGFADKYPGSSMKFEVVTYDDAVATLSTQLAANAPDIVGPVGIGGLGSFKGQWVDLGPYLTDSNYDMSVYDPKTVEFFQQDGVQVGVPFDLYPSMLWYKKEFFDEIDLTEPPHEWGATYTMPDGSEVDWSYDTLRQVAMLLTVDKNGKDATDPAFDSNNIVQFGFEPQRDDLRQTGAYFGAGSLVGEDGKTVVIPDAWEAAWKFMYDGIWKDHFIMTEAQFNDAKVGGGDQAFFGGHVAMANNFLWTSYGVTGDEAVVKDWNLAAIPSYNGTTTSPLNADTFSILKNSKNPDAAFAGMAYLHQDSADELLPIYGGIPAVTSQQDPFFQGLENAEGYPEGVDWKVAKDAIQYADIPNFEDYMPKYNETLAVLSKYRSRWTTTPGLDMDQEIEKLRAEIQAKWDAA